jgi:hydroxymethylbilane synthase
VTRVPRSLDGLPQGAVVGTSSVRRARQVTHLRPDLVVADLRGNVPTRLEKLAAGGEMEAILLAEAGLVRLGYLAETPEIGGPEPVIGMKGLFALRLPEDYFFPAAGQGAVGLEIRSDDEDTRKLVESIGDEATWRRITAEREFLRLLDAGCHTPVGVYSVLTHEGLFLKARVFPESGGRPRTGEARGNDPITTAKALFDSLT